MNVIFLSVSSFTDAARPGIYPDLLRAFAKHGHRVVAVQPRDRKYGLPTSLSEEAGIRVLRVRTLNIERAGLLEKGLGTVLLEWQFTSAIRRRLAGERFDLILYATPPVTLPRVIRFLKRRNPGASTYLLLKDIFPQNAVDLGMMSPKGIKGILYRYFRRKERSLYALSDHIGCMSPANVAYLLSHNPELRKERVEVCPNSCDPETPAPADSVLDVRKRFGISPEAVVFLYGGNLGKAQGIPFLLQCLQRNAGRTDCHFVVVGGGQDAWRVQDWVRSCRPSNVTYQEALPTEEYEGLVKSCDVGLIFLDARFTIPNYPSRILSYLKAGKPVICATDPNTDIGRIAAAQGYGLSVSSEDTEAFTACVDALAADRALIRAMGLRGHRYFLENYTVDTTYSTIIRHFEN